MAADAPPAPDARHPPLMSEERPADDGEGRDVEFEVVDALVVLEEARRPVPARPPAVALAQAAAVAATGFVAGVATAAVLGRRRQRRLGPAPGPRATGTFDVVSSRSYLVDVHRLEHRG